MATSWRKVLLSEDQKKTIFADIKNYVGQLRQPALRTQGMVCSAMQNAALGYRIGSRLFGPLSHNNFHPLIPTGCNEAQRVRTKGVRYGSGQPYKPVCHL